AHRRFYKNTSSEQPQAAVALCHGRTRLSLADYLSVDNPTPYPRSIGIKTLARQFSQSLERLGLIWKVFRNKELTSQRAQKLVLGQLRDSVLCDGTLLLCPNQRRIVAWGGVKVCDVGT